MSDPHREARDKLQGRYEVRVLEPSPPAIHEAPWYADDPAARGSVSPGTPLVGPTSVADLTWDEICREDDDLREWCAARWLGGWRRIGLPPPAFGETLHHLHVLAEHVLAAARHRSNGKIGLRFTRGGFGTPFFGDDEQVRIEGGLIVHQRMGHEERAIISTPAAAASFVGIPAGAPTDVYAPTTTLEPQRTLTMDPEPSSYLGDLIGFGTSVLEELRARATDDEDVSRVQLWPEHFDVAVELGEETRGGRASYGLSPGDEEHSEPYLYVAPWREPSDDPWWNATAFSGARCDLGRLVEASDQRLHALGFFEEARARLSARTTRGE